MAELNGGNQLKVKGPFGIDLAVSGALVIALLAFAAIIGLALFEHYKRRVEIEHLVDNVRMENEAVRETVRVENQKVRDAIYYLDCRVQLQLYIGQKPRGEPIDWSGMPEILYKCVPEFFYKRLNK
jgi:hypothetical protein